MYFFVDSSLFGTAFVKAEENPKILGAAGEYSRIFFNSKLDTIYPLYLVIYSIAILSVISLIINVLVITKKLSKTALSLIRNEQKAGKHKGLDFFELLLSSFIAADHCKFA
ncbi:MAG: hypothetical protein NC485_00410 [Ruminococcus flavefaciens]|nr:hypothetical protein [Ruminococcus flavefaciens]